MDAEWILHVKLDACEPGARGKIVKQRLDTTGPHPEMPRTISKLELPRCLGDDESSVALDASGIAPLA